MPLAPTMMSMRRSYFHPWALCASITGSYIIFMFFDGMVIISIMRVNNSKCFQMLIILHEVVISLELLRANELEKIKLSFKWHQQPFNVWKCILSLVCELKTLRILTTILNVDKLVPSTSQLPKKSPCSIYTYPKENYQSHN